MSPTEAERPVCGPSSVCRANLVYRSRHAFQRGGQHPLRQSVREVRSKSSGKERASVSREATRPSVSAEPEDAPRDHRAAGRSSVLDLMLVD